MAQNAAERIPVMAKRKRLGPATLSEAADVSAAITDSEADREILPGRVLARPTGATAPIANVAADAATQAALSNVIDTITKAKREGRMVLELDPDRIDANHLMRDRTRVEPQEMAVLVTSIAERGQQSPIEVVDLGEGRYGLISGWRRLYAIKQLGDRRVLALLRAPHDAPEAYLAMIEENEIRVGLSYYERARIVSKSVSGGVFESDKAALQSLFRSASRAKRSKIKSFLPLVTYLDGVLHFPEDLGERLGLTLSRALEDDRSLPARLIAALSPAPTDAVEEQTVIKNILSAPSDQAPLARQTETHRLLPNLRAEIRADGSVLISGKVLTPTLTRDLCAWLRQHGEGVQD